ncbi:MAG: DUF1214 domain-containing protein [Candidatus Microthrix parvicella]
MTADAMRRLLDHVGEALEEMGPFDSAQEEADAHRHLLRLCSAGLELYVERADPARPLPTVWMSPTRKFLGDSPDTIYTTVPFSPDHTYALTIQPGNAVYIGVVVYARDEPGGPVRAVSSVIDTRLESVDGRFEIEVGSDVDPDDPQGLLLDDRSFWIMVREYFSDPRNHRASTITIERTDGDITDGLPNPDDLTVGIDAAADWILSQARADAALYGLMAFPQGSSVQAEQDVEVPDDLVSLFYPTPDIAYQGCRFTLETDDQLEITFRPPACRFWSVVVSTPWFESLEQRSTPASINSATAEVDEDGKVTVVVSESNPGLANWIPLRGYRKGQVAYRVLLGESELSEATYVVGTNRRSGDSEPLAVLATTKLDGRDDGGR